MKNLLLIWLSLIYGIFVNAQSVVFHTDDITGGRFINITPQIINNDTATIMMVEITSNNGAARINYALFTNQKSDKARNILVTGQVLMTGTDFVNWDGTKTGASRWLVKKISVTLTN